MKEDLSPLIAVLLEQARKGEDVSSGLDRIRKAIQGDDSLSGKLHALEESLREVIPDEKQRYQAAIKAVSTTLNVTRSEVVAAVTKQV
jgi:hypothetical protein